MTLPASGSISISQIQTEFGRGNNLGAYRGTTWFTDAGGSGTFSGGTISMSEFHGKRANSPVTIPSLAAQMGGGSFMTDGVGSGTTTLTFNPDGTWVCTVANGAAPYTYYGNWASPTSAGIGSSYYIRWTRTITQNLGYMGSATESIGWILLTPARPIEVFHSGTGSGVVGALYTIEISSDNAGAIVVATATNVGIFYFNEG